MRQHTLNEILCIGAVLEFPNEQREAIWRDISAALPRGEARASSRFSSKIRKPGTRRFIVITTALLLGVSVVPFASLWEGDVLIEDAPPPLAAWHDGYITLEHTRVTLPLGSELSQEGILDACGAKAVLPGVLIVSGLDTINTDEPGEYNVQITLRDMNGIALGSAFLTLVIEYSQQT